MNIDTIIVRETVFINYTNTGIMLAGVHCDAKISK